MLMIKKVKLVPQMLCLLNVFVTNTSKHWGGGGRENGITYPFDFAIFCALTLWISTTNIGTSEEERLPTNNKTKKST